MTGIVGALTVGHLRDRVTPRVLMGWSSVVAGAALLVKFDVPVVTLTFALTSMRPRPVGLAGAAVVLTLPIAFAIVASRYA